LIILVKYPQETLLEDGRGERIRQHNNTVRRVGERLHLQETDLVQATGKEVDSMSIVRGPLGETFVEL
jgi:hypothetical protein